LNRIKELRQEKKVSQKELSEIIGISSSQLYYFENGERKPRDEKVWEKLANYFDVSVAYLRGDSSIRNEDDINFNTPLDIFNNNSFEFNNQQVITDKTMEEIFKWMEKAQGVMSSSTLSNYDKLLIRKNLALYYLKMRVEDETTPIDYYDWLIALEKYDNLNKGAKGLITHILLLLPDLFDKKAYDNINDYELAYYQTRKKITTLLDDIYNGLFKDNLKN
jgi:transcriptional regulator with XRE-family HTH domain